jgi:PAS domain S-box-containing protein
MNDEANHIKPDQPSSEQPADEQTRIAEIGRIVSSSLDMADVYPQFAVHARALVRADRMVIAFLSEDETELIDQYIDGFDIPGSGIGMRRKITDKASHEAFLRDQKSVVFSGSALQEFNPGSAEEDIRLKTGLKSLMFAPLIWQGNAFGVIAFRAVDPDAFGDHQAEIGQQIASQIAGAVATSLQYAELQRESREQEQFAEIRQIVGTSLDIDEIFETFAKQTRLLVPADRLILTTIDQDGSLIGRHVDGMVIKESNVPILSPVIRSELLDDTSGSRSHFSANGEAYEKYVLSLPEEVARYAAGLRAILSIPLMWRGDLVGSLTFRSKDAEAYGARDIEVAEQIAEHIASAVHSSNQYRLLEKESQQRELLAEIGRIISSTTDLESVFTAFVRAANKLIAFDRLAISKIDMESGEISDAHVAGHQMASGNISGPFSLAESIVPKSVYVDHQVVIANADVLAKRSETDIADDNRLRIAAGLISAMFVPVVLQGTTVGHLVFRSRQSDPYTETDARLAEHIAAQLSGVISASQQREIIQAKSAERERLADEQRRIAEIGRVVSSTLDLTEVFDKFNVEARELLPFDRVVMISLAEDRSKVAVELINGIGQDISNIGDTLVTNLNAFQAKALESGDPVGLNGDDFLERAKSIPSEQKRADDGLNSVLMSPLVWQGKVIGLITFRSVRNDAYGEHEVNLATQISAQIAGSVAASNQYRLLESEYRQREQIAEIGRIVSSTLELDEVFTRFLEVARELLPHDRIAIITLSEDGSNVVDNLVDGVDSKSAPAGAVLSIDDNPLQLRAFKEATEIVLSGDEYRTFAENEPAEKVRLDAGLISVLMTPMVWQGEVIGVINFRSKQENAYGENEIKIAKQISAQIAGAVATSNQYRRLEESETNYRGLIENSHILVWRMDAKGRFSYVSKSLEKVLGYTSEEMLGRQYTDFTPERYEPNVDEKVRNHFTNRAKYDEVRADTSVYLNKDGTKVHLTFSSASMFDSDGEFIGIRGTALDITAEREAQDAILIQTAALEAASDAVIILMPDTSIRYVNDAFTEQTGYSLEDVIGKSSSILRATDSDQGNYLDTWEVVQQGQIWRGTQLSRRKDGSVIMVDASLNPIFAEDGTISSYVSIRRDVTERIQAEQDRQARAELDAQNHQLQEINKQREEFFSSVSHELRTPLTAVTAFSDILSRNRDGNLSGTQLDQLEVIKRNSRSLISLVEDMLDMSRLSSKSLRIDRLPVEIDEIVQSTVESLGPTARERQQSLGIRSETAGVWIDADKGRLVQVLSNLITNACKYSPDDSSIEISTAVKDESVVLRVKDSGFGMSSEDLRMIFSPFYRSNRDEIQTQSGTGLGMAISKTLVELHNGQIEIDSTLNVGTTVTVTIPGVIDQ